jgi:hypothetical protein
LYHEHLVGSTFSTMLSPVNPEIGT